MRILNLTFSISVVLISTKLTFAKEPLVDVKGHIPTIKLDIRYFTDENFVGKKIDAYEAPKCLLTLDATKALSAVQKELLDKNLSLKVFDCYRPQSAVNHFVRWAKDLNDTKMKAEYYPRVDKRNLFRDGYIASKSGHSRGSTLDVTIVDLNSSELDMGTGFDYFDLQSHTENSSISSTSLKNRLFLRDVMNKYGFKNLKEEWWHYSLINEPHPLKYFDIVVK